MCVLIACGSHRPAKLWSGEEFFYKRGAMKKLIALVTLALAGGTASAELVNISGVGMHTATDNAIACTIIDKGTTPINGGVLLVFFAEGYGAGNPSIRVWSMDRSYVSTNENWMDGFDITRNGVTQHINLADVYPQDPLYYPSLLRAPYRTTDAAVFVAGLLGETFCAESYDRSGLGTPQRVSVSATDMNAIYFKSLAIKSGNGDVEDVSPVSSALAAIQ